MAYILGIFLSVLLCASEILSIKLLKVVVPPYKLKGEEAVMECHYELEGDSLYAVKWYKENEEFYRYVPKSKPPLFSYKLDGVKVDHDRSNSRLVTLKAVNLRSSGTYRCEVSAEAPFFSSAQKEARMEVLFLPKTGPQITGEQLEYEIGDTLSLNCTSGKSYPPSSLKWYINDKSVPEKFLLRHPPLVFPPGLISTVLGLRLTIVSSQFIAGSMKVRCVATVSPLLWQADKESILQKIDDREALLLVKNTAYTNNLGNVVGLTASVGLFLMQIFVV